MKDEFVSVVSHEPYTPSLNSRCPRSFGVVSQPPNRKKSTHAGNCSQNTDRLVLNNDILDIERIESGRVTMVKQTCDAANLMIQQQMPCGLWPTRQESSVSPLSAQLWADPDRIIQTQLTPSNAIKFSTEKYTIWLSAELVRSEILFQVRDQGEVSLLIRSRRSLNAFNRWMPLTLVKEAPD